MMGHELKTTRLGLARCLILGSTALSVVVPLGSTAGAAALLPQHPATDQVAAGAPAGGAGMQAGAAGAATADPAAQADDAQAQPAEGGDIVVTGSRLSVSGFTAPTPVTVIGSERIQQMASPNVGEALAQLPAFRSTTSPANSVVGSNISPVNAGARIADLRGLGPSRTLVLVSGRRFAPSTSTGTVDLNLIPTLLVGSADIVTGGASAAYGSDAVSGVINIQLDTKLQGLKGTIGYGVTDVGDGKEYSVQLAGGTSFADGRGHFVAGLEYDKDKGTGGCYTRRFCANELADLTGTPGANGRPAHNITTNVHTSTLTPGGLITATTNTAGVRTAASGGVLGGIQFDAAGQPTTFAYGQYANSLFQQGGSGTGLNAFFGDPKLSIPVTRYNGYMHGEYEISSAFKPFVEVSYGHVAGYTRGPEIRDTGYPATGDVIKVDNPYLPASIQQTMVANNIASVTIGKLGTDFGTMDSVTKRDTFRFVGGASGDLGSGWHWDGYVEYGLTDYHQSTKNDRITARFAKAIDAVRTPGGSIACRVNADADPTNDDAACVPLNILGQGQYSAAAKAYAFGTTYQNSTYTETVGALNLRGSPFETWAGPVAVATGVETRKDTLKIRVDPISAANGFYVYNSTPSDGSVNVIEGYGEVAVPLLRDSVVGKSLDLNGAVRQTHYNSRSPSTSADFDATTWKIGLTYRPVEWLLLRATESRDFRAPNTAELFTSPVGGQSTITDSKTSTQVFAQTFTGGNINLKPEHGRTFTAGATMQPGGALRGLRLSADYYKIRVDSAIATLGAQVIVNTCNTTNAADICGLVTRDSNGILKSVQVLYLNLNRVDMRGIDIEGSYRAHIGSTATLDLRALATHTMDYTNSSLPGINRAGDNGYNGLPSWVVDSFATLSLGRLEVNAQEHFISAGKVDATYVGPEDPGYSVTLANSINTNRVPSRFYTNLGASYKLIDRGTQKLQIYANVINLFDTTPPPYWNGDNNSVNYDNIGRRYRVGVRFGF